MRVSGTGLVLLVRCGFWSIYKKSYASWRDDWIRYAPDWNGPLGNNLNFDHLILLANTSVTAYDHAEWFCHYCDPFRDQPPRTDPRSFPRRGQLIVSASRILEVILTDIGLITTGFGRHRSIPASLHTVWTTLIRQVGTKPFRWNATCSCCKGPNTVRELKMPAVPWFWFERDQRPPVMPWLALTFGSQPLQLTYCLRAIVYSGGNYFTVRFREQSGGWWRHDGRVAFGVPQPDDSQFKAVLLTNGDRFVCALICRRVDH
jgi:hypothetical protein